jgi:hypothetical protein
MRLSTGVVAACLSAVRLAAHVESPPPSQFVQAAFGHWISPGTGLMLIHSLYWAGGWIWVLGVYMRLFNVESERHPGLNHHVSWFTCGWYINSEAIVSEILLYHPP